MQLRFFLAATLLAFMSCGAPDMTLPAPQPKVNSTNTSSDGGVNKTKSADNSRFFTPSDKDLEADFITHMGMPWETDFEGAELSVLNPEVDVENENTTLDSLSQSIDEERESYNKGESLLEIEEVIREAESAIEDDFSNTLVLVEEELLNIENPDLKIRFLQFSLTDVEVKQLMQQAKKTISESTQEKQAFLTELTEVFERFADVYELAEANDSDVDNSGTNVDDSELDDDSFDDDTLGQDFDSEEDLN